MLISMIVPFYNAEAYLKASLLALASQSYAQLEILLIDDGSRDASFSIAQAVVQQDSRFQLFRLEENQGQGLARNYGLSKARGEYVWFIDADDQVAQSDSVQQIVRSLGDRRPQVVEFRFEVAQVIDVANDQALIHYRYHKSRLASGFYATKTLLTQALEAPFHQHNDYLNFALWTNWYQRSFLQHLDAQQLAKTKHQDNISLLWLAASDEVLFLNEKHYRYFLHQGNSSAKSNKASYYQDVLRLSQQWQAFYVQHLKGGDHQHQALAMLYFLHIFNFLLFGDQLRYLLGLPKKQQFLVIDAYWQQLKQLAHTQPLPQLPQLMSGGHLFGIAYRPKNFARLWQALLSDQAISAQKQKTLWLAVAKASRLGRHKAIKQLLPYGVVMWLQAVHQSGSLKALVRTLLPYFLYDQRKR